MPLSRSEKRLLVLFALVCIGLFVWVFYRWRTIDPLKQPTDLYPHVNAANTFRVDPNWPDKAGPRFGPVTGVAIDPENRVWVLGLGSPPVRLYDSQGNYLKGWGTGQFGMPHQIRLDSGGHVWIVDCGRHSVHKFKPDGTLLLTLGSPGTSGDDETHFNEPTDIAFGSGADLFIADGYVNARIVHLSSDGRFVKSWGSRGHRPGQFSLVHSIVADSKNRLLVADRNNARIQIFDTKGRFLEQWSNIMIPWTLWITPADEIWACGSTPAAWREDNYALATPPHDQVLVKFNSSGRVLQVWSAPLGDQPGQLNWAHGIAMDSSGNLFCGDYHGKRVQKFQLIPAANGTQP